MEDVNLDPRLRVMQQAKLKDRVVLLRVDHNAVSEGRIDDPYRIEATIGTLFAVVARGGRPILMTHVGRPRDKKTGMIKCRESESTAPIASYLERKLAVKVKVPELGIDPQRGMGPIGKSLQTEIARLKDGATDILYLPNTRWFYGEEAKGDERDQFASELASLADIYINDAFGSWQPHASTYDVARKMPSYAGMLLQKELANLRKVLEPERPFLAVIAGAKYDTKIGPLKALYQKVDHLILGGLMYNTFLAAKYGVHVEGISDEDKALAADLVALDKTGQKIIPLEHVVESDTLEGRSGGRHRTRAIESLAAGKSFRYIVDIDPASFSVERVKDVFQKARTIFLNAVVGFMPFFSEGSEALYRMVASNTSAMKLFAGGDTLQELRNLCPGIYLDGVDDPRTYYFTGGGSVLTAIENGSPYSIKPVEALMDENT